MNYFKFRQARNVVQSMALTVLLLSASSVAAHAFLQRALPGVDSTVHEAPAELKLWFSESIEPAFSSVEVIDAAGKRVDGGSARHDGGDTRVLQVSLAKLAPGAYHVTWRVLSVDTHVAKGEFNFAVAP